MLRLLSMAAGFCLLLGSCVSNIGTANNDAANDSNPLPHAGSGFPPGEYDSSSIINWYVKPGNPYFIQNENGDAYLYVAIKTGQHKEDTNRIPLNISLVLDRSGSMGGEKIEYAKRAARFLVDQLGAQDYLSRVNYDDVVEITSPSQIIKNKEAIKSMIDKIYDRGSTNLSGGMLQGYSQVKSTRKEGFVNRVLLLTDGLANAGITAPDQLKKLVEMKYKEEGIALSTFGLGADYNEDLLTMLAETGRANYYFIDSADKIPPIFARELKGLLSVVAQNALVSVNIPKGFTCEKVYGYLHDEKDGTIQVKFNDVYSNDEKAILIKLKKTGTVSAEPVFHCVFNYTDASQFKQVKLEKERSIRG